MERISVEYPVDWTEYELIDTGDGEKLERYGTYTLVRPDPRILWPKSLPVDAWNCANATYRRSDPKTGEWFIESPPPDPWRIQYHNLTFTLRPTEFKHVGVFPEQAVNWMWLEKIIKRKSLNILNLFAYTGGASMAAALAGARVTHLDAVKSSIDWANDNVKASHLEKAYIRWIQDDAMKFVLREGKRGNTYDGIIMDPPRFGRGTKGEVWKLEYDLPKLIRACAQILSPSPALFLINTYTADMSSVTLQHLVGSILGDKGGIVTSGELALKESRAGRLLPSGIFARWCTE
jgi:23S rRNA (cytosine1962-C5)-methyltransferase